MGLGYVDALTISAKGQRMFGTGCIQNISLWFIWDQYEHLLPRIILQETFSQHNATCQTKRA